MREEWTARRTSGGVEDKDSGRSRGVDSISYKYKINVVFVARVSRDNHTDCFNVLNVMFRFLIIIFSCEFFAKRTGGWAAWYIGPGKNKIYCS